MGIPEAASHFFDFSGVDVPKIADNGGVTHLLEQLLVALYLVAVFLLLLTEFEINDGCGVSLYHDSVGTLREEVPVFIA